MSHTTSRRGLRVLAATTAAMLCTALVACDPPPTGPPQSQTAPTISGALEVGSTLVVDPGTWGGAPATYAYLYQTCNADGTGCAKSAGLFANGPRPQFLLTAATAGKHLRVRVTATNVQGVQRVWSTLVGPIAAYPSTAAPKVELVNGVPDTTTWSNATIFEFQETGSGVTLTCKLDTQAATTCPANRKPSYSGLAIGSHTFTVTATNAYGTAAASHTWSVVASPAPTPCPDCYHPAVGSTWQWQLNPDVTGGTIDTSIPADMYDIDGFTNDAAMVAALKALPGTSVPNRGVTCYISVGTLENWRPDARAYDPMLLGNAYYGFEDERWIDIRQLSKLAPLFEFRMDMCKAKGFDAIEFDNMDSWYADNKTGLNITKPDAVAFVKYLAREAHERGMSMALKSVVEMIPDVRDHVDFSVVEECFENQECTLDSPNTGGQYGYDQMIEIGKPVFETEYDAYSPTNNVCAESNALQFSTIYKNVDLDSYRVSCNG